MIQTIRKIVRSTGFDLIKYKPSQSKWLRLRKVLDWLEIDLVLDVGANVGQFGQDLRSIGYSGKIVSFEPLSKAHAALQKTAAGDALWTVAPRGALGAEPHTTEINISGNSESSSLLAMTDVHTKAEPQSAYIGKETIEVTTLAQYFEAHPIGKQRVFLKTDAQGYDLQVIKGAQDQLQHIKGIYCEMALADVYAEQPRFEDFHAYLTSAGFTLLGFTPDFTDPDTGRILMQNGLYGRL